MEKLIKILLVDLTLHVVFRVLFKCVYFFSGG